ncbi:hypothetical protein GGI03_005078 [Coemansia sp. RSA 2337]|nr:hypothetical protein GGI03_005078 [Coemansia sp. RSA 2337]
MSYSRTGRCVSDWLGLSTLRLVKCLEIKLDERTIYSGKALRMLSSAPYNGRVFPLARELLLTFLWDEFDGSGESGGYDDIDPLVDKANISAFVQRIRFMAPTVGVIRVQLGATSSEDRGVATDSVEYHCRNDRNVIKEVQFGGICNLVSIVCIGEGLSSQLTRLARQNAPTLQSLTIDTENDKVSISGLIRDVDDICVVFPCLLKLKLKMGSNDDDSICLDSNGPALFPRLRHLDLFMYSKFDMYLFFKGNAATLECLSLELNRSMISMLRRYSVFTPTSHPNLKYVGINYWFGFTSTIFATSADAMQFTLDIGPKAPVRKISGSLSGNTLLPSYHLLGNYTCIQVLSLGPIPIVLWDTIALIKSLPLLSDLHTGSVSLGTIPGGMTRSKLSSYVRSTYAPISLRFRCWHIHDDYRSNAAQTVECVLLLALACPNFDYAAPHTIRRITFDKPIRDAIASDMFKDHAARLRPAMMALNIVRITLSIILPASRGTGIS